MSEVLLFVYGSLRRGEAAHGMLDAAEFAGEARTEPSFTLVNLGSYPALLDEGTTSVVGELYRVSASMLASLDEYEAHPELYLRRDIKLLDGSAAQTYIFVDRRGAKAHGATIASGDWLRKVDLP